MVTRPKSIGQAHRMMTQMQGDIDDLKIALMHMLREVGVQVDEQNFDEELARTLECARDVD